MSEVKQRKRDQHCPVSASPSQNGERGFINTTSIGMWKGKKVFIKMNSNNRAKHMFIGEMRALQVIAATGIFRVPKPLKVRNCTDHGAELIMEHLDLQQLPVEYQGQLGRQLALLHLDNIIKLQQLQPKHRKFHRYGDPVTKFGFFRPTSCGFILNNNKWNTDWAMFYRRRLQYRMKLYLKDHPDGEMARLWCQVYQLIPKLFTNITVYPSLLHGDLWTGNTGVTPDGQVVLYDAASFYGHHEFDLAISNLLGKFDEAFYTEYHKIIPPGESLYFTQRQQLYQLYYFLNQHTHRTYYQRELPGFLPRQVGIDMLQCILTASDS